MAKKPLEDEIRRLEAKRYPQIGWTNEVHVVHTYCAEDYDTTNWFPIMLSNSFWGMCAVCVGRLLGNTMSNRGGWYPDPLGLGWYPTPPADEEEKQRRWEKSLSELADNPYLTELQKEALKDKAIRRFRAEMDEDL